MPDPFGTPVEPRGSQDRHSASAPAPGLVSTAFPEAVATPLGSPTPPDALRWPDTLTSLNALDATVAAILAGPSALLRFCPRGFRRRVVVRGPESLVSLLAFEPGQREHVHQHRDSGEYFHGVLGCGHLLIEDTWRPLAPGVTHFRPAGAWHGVAATSRLLLVSIQAPIPARNQTVWLDPPDRLRLGPEGRDHLGRYRCTGCPCCGGHLRRQRPTTACTNCGNPRAPARCENCGWAMRPFCLPSAQPRAG